MKLRILLFLSFIAATVLVWGRLFPQKQYTPATFEKTITKDPLYKEGDLIFQSSSGGQGLAIQVATGSKYNHVGMLYLKNNQWYVLEAIQPVVLTPLKSFIAHGDGNKYVIKRLKNRDQYITDSTLQLIHKEEDKLMGKNYDLYFGWDDELIYCSELVWKVYNRALGLEIGALQKLSEFNLTHPIVQAKLQERFGKDIPYDEKVISPARIFESDLLETVVEK